MQKYYLGDNASRYVPFDRLYLTQHYMMPMWGTFNWDKVNRDEIAANLARLRDEEDAVYDNIQMYINVPYCQSMCTYCDFNVINCPRPGDDILEKYVDYLIKEIDYYLAQPYVQSRTFTSIHIGGGSPSVLPLKALERLFSHLSKSVPNYDKIETTFTGEARTLRSRDLLQLVKDFGWNRITWGIETLDDAIKKQIGRHDSKEDVEAVFSNLEGIGYRGSRCIDIMYHLPGQTIKDFQKELSAIIEDYRPDSVDAFSTVYLPYRPLHRLIVHGKVKQPASVWELLQMREHLYDYMLEKGYSNTVSETFSKTTERTHYQTGQGARQSVIPVGVSARGNFKDMVTINPEKIELWMRNIDDFGVSTQTIQPIGRKGVFDRIMVMWPRYKEINKDYFHSFSDVKHFKKMQRLLQQHVELGLVDESPNSYTLNKLGVIWHGNMQNDYIWHALKAIAKAAIKKTLSVRKKHFDRMNIFGKNAITEVMWTKRNQFPRHK